MTAVTNTLIALAGLAHETSVLKGFYSPGHTESLHATKVALILTEVNEVLEEVVGVLTEETDLNLTVDSLGMTADARKLLGDEIADVLIRCLDFIEYLGESSRLVDLPRVNIPPTRILTEVLSMFILGADMVQADRKQLNDDRRNSELAQMTMRMVIHCFNLAETFHLDLLEQAMVKMDYNHGRPKLHNRRY